MGRAQRWVDIVLPSFRRRPEHRGQQPPIATPDSHCQRPLDNPLSLRACPVLDTGKRARVRVKDWISFIGVLTTHLPLTTSIKGDCSWASDRFIMGSMNLKVCLQCLGALVVCILLATTLLACTSEDEEPTKSDHAHNPEPKSQSAKQQWSKDKDEWKSLPEGTTTLDWTAKLAEDAGGEVHYVDHPRRGDRTVLVLPEEFVEGETPLIVSLHGYGGDSAWHIAYVPLHERVNTDGFALLLPNGAPDGEGNRSWNPTDDAFTEKTGKAREDDVAFLTELVAEARMVGDFGPVYFFGYSNGGFMSYHLACKGLPGLRAVASLSGTSYVEDSTCEGVPPVSVLHIHGTADSVVLFEGDETEPDPKSNGERAFYAGAHDMVTRWSQRAGCDWPEDPQPYATLDLDQYVPGSETQAFRLESVCADSINIELWTGDGSGHAPGYADAFTDALVDWLLSQE